MLVLSLQVPHLGPSINLRGLWRVQHPCLAEKHAVMHMQGDAAIKTAEAAAGVEFMRAPTKPCIVAPVVHTSWIGYADGERIGSALELLGDIAVIGGLGDHVVSGQLPVHEDLDALPKTADMKRDMLAVPRTGNIELPPEPGNTAIGTIARLRVYICVLILRGGVRARTKLAPIILLHRSRQSYCRPLTRVK